MWWTLLPFVAMTLVVVLGPGLVINWAIGMRPLTALGLAPLVSTGVVAVAAVLADLVGLPWGPLPIGGLTLLLGMAGWLVRRRRGWRPDQPVPGGTGWLPGALGFAAVIGVVDALRVVGEPKNFSQTYDNIFHLNGVRWMVDNRNGSALDMRMVTGDDPAAFYPTAWHDVASGTLLGMGSNDAVAATNALIIVCLAVIWPLSGLLLVRRILGTSPVNTLATAVLIAGFTPMPYLLLRFGVLYPNFLGLCLLPAMLAVAVSLLDLGAGPRWPLPQTFVVAVIGVVTLVLSHPNVALTLLCVIGSVMITCWAWRRPRTRWRLLAWAGWGVAALAAYAQVRPPQVALFWGPKRTVLDAGIEAALLSPLESRLVVVPALLTTVGIIAVLWTRRHWWLLGSHAALCLLWLVAASRDIGRLRDYIVGPWYNDPYRLAAMLPITAIPLAAVGLVFLVEHGTSWWQRAGRPAPDQALIALITAGILLVTTQLVGGKPQMVEWTHESYRITDQSALVDSDEYAVLMKVPELVGVDEVIAVNPWNGSSMAYALTGRPTTATHVLYSPDPDKQVLIDGLDEAATDPAVCPAIINLDVQWVLDFGNQRLINNERKPYPGWDDLATASGFEVAYQQGSAVLYKVTACGLG